jgi:hypothetical protein
VLDDRLPFDDFDWDSYFLSETLLNIDKPREFGLEGQYHFSLIRQFRLISQDVLHKFFLKNSVFFLVVHDFIAKKLG